MSKDVSSAEVQTVRPCLAAICVGQLDRFVSIHSTGITLRIHAQRFPWEMPLHHWT